MKSGLRWPIHAKRFACFARIAPFRTQRSAPVQRNSFGKTLRNEVRTISQEETKRRFRKGRLWRMCPRSADQESWSELTRSRSGWSASNPTLAKSCRISPKSAKIPRKYSIREPGAGHARRFPKLVLVCPFRFRRSKWSRPMQITPPPIIVLAAVWRADRPSPIIRPDLRADPGKRCPDQGTTCGTGEHPPWYPRSGFLCRGRSECALAPVCGAGEHPRKPPFGNHPFRTPE